MQFNLAYGSQAKIREETCTESGSTEDHESISGCVAFHHGNSIRRQEGQLVMSNKYKGEYDEHSDEYIQ